MHHLNQPSKFKTKNWVEVNDKSRGEHTMLIIKLNLKQQC